MTALVPDRPAASQRRSQIPGEPGVWVFIICEMVVFTALFGVVAFNGIVNRQMFADAQQILNQPLGLVNTCVLIAGSVLAVLAIAAVQCGQHPKAARHGRGTGHRLRQKSGSSATTSWNCGKHRDGSAPS